MNDLKPILIPSPPYSPCVRGPRSYFLPKTGLFLQRLQGPLRSPGVKLQELVTSFYRVSVRLWWTLKIVLLTRTIYFENYFMFVNSIFKIVYVGQ